MKNSDYVKITILAQITYFLCMLLCFVCIYLFEAGVFYTYALAMIGSLLVVVFPVDFVCFVVNVIFLLKQLNSCSKREMFIKTTIIVTSFAFLTWLKIALYHYADVLVGVV